MPETTSDLEWIERMKEVQRIQYDYFKHLTTLGSGSALFTIAFWEKLFMAAEPAARICGFVSILLFACTIVLALSALPIIGNIILYINGVQKAQINNDQKARREMVEKIGKSLDKMHRLDNLSIFAYCFGILSLIIYAAINIFD